MTNAHPTIQIDSDPLGGNPYMTAAQFQSVDFAGLVVAHEQRVANLIALVGTPEVPAKDRAVILQRVYEMTGISTVEPPQGGGTLRL